MNEIRVPAKVVRYWTEKIEPYVNPILFCALDDGRVYQSVKTEEGRVWVLHTPAIPDR